MSDELQNELTAYLDGELDAAASRQVEDRLKHDPAARKDLLQLESAWDLLEHLDRAVVNDAFSKTTLEMVAVAAAHETPPPPASRRPATILGIVLGAAACLAVGYACGAWLWPDPNRQLLADLPVLENMTLYAEGDSIEFLRKLERSGLFDEPAEGSSSVAAAEAEPMGDEPAERREAIERMTSPERNHLRRKQEHFARFSAAEQARLRQLYNDIESDPHDDQLRAVLVRYHEWLDPLAISVRTEILELPAEERLARLDQLKRQQAEQKSQELAGAPSADDLKQILDALADIAWQRREELLASLSPARRQFLERLDEAGQRQALFWLQAQRWRFGGKAQLAKEDQWKSLVDSLSPAARHQLAAQATPADKARLLGTWTQLAVRHRVESGGLLKLLPRIEPPELRRFVNEELNESQRDALGPLGAFQRRQILMRLYFLPPDRLADAGPGQVGWPAAGDAPRPRRLGPPVKR